MVSWMVGPSATRSEATAGKKQASSACDTGGWRMEWSAWPAVMLMDICRAAQACAAAAGNAALVGDVLRPTGLRLENPRTVPWFTGSVPLTCRLCSLDLCSGNATIM